jgi:hypothetical protein
MKILKYLSLPLLLATTIPAQVTPTGVIVTQPYIIYDKLPTGVFAAYGTTVPTAYFIGASGSWQLVPTNGNQPVGNIPTWSSSCTCVVVTPSADGMSATFKILTTAAVGQSVTIAAVSTPYPDGTPGAAGSVSFTLAANPYPAGFTITRTQ